MADALRRPRLTALVIPPGQLNNLRSHYGSGRNTDDRFDAYVLADVVILFSETYPHPDAPSITSLFLGSAVGSARY